MASTLEELIASLSANTAAYTPLTQAQMQQQAQNRYQSAYDRQRLSAKQTYETTDQALMRELDSLISLYDGQRAQSEQAYRQTYAQADRQALSRGMQRSSYNGATLSNIALAGEAARAQIDQAQAQKQDDVTRQRTLLSTQLAQQLSQYDKSQQSDILSYIDQLQSREYERQTQAQQQQNELSMKLYEYRHQLEQEAAEQARWQAEYNAKYASSKRSGSGSSSRKKSSSVSQSLFLPGTVLA